MLTSFTLDLCHELAARDAEFREIQYINFRQPNWAIDKISHTKKLKETEI